MTPAVAVTTSGCAPWVQVLPDRGGGAFAAGVSGEVVVGGVLEPRTGVWAPAEWINGRLHVLGGLSAGSTAVAVNRHGVIVGGNGTSAFAWVNGRTTLLGAPRNMASIGVTAINDLGEIAGFARTKGGTVALRWFSAADTPRVLKSRTSHAVAYAINNGGSLAGVDGDSSIIDGPTAAVRWLPGLKPHYLVGPKDFDSSHSAAYAINDYGATAGTAMPIAGGAAYYEAVVWNPGGSSGRPLGVLPGDNDAYASSISNAGYVAGTSFRFEWDVSGYPVPDHGWVWPGSGPIRYLPVPGGDYVTTDSYASHVDDTGTVVGEFAYAIGDDYGNPANYGPYHAVVWHCALA